MRRDFKITRFSTYTNKYCFAYMKCLTCDTEMGRTIANATINNPREKQVGDIVQGDCFACAVVNNRNQESKKADYELLNAMRFVNCCLRQEED